MLYLIWKVFKLPFHRHTFRFDPIKSDGDISNKVFELRSPIIREIWAEVVYKIFFWTHY